MTSKEQQIEIECILNDYAAGVNDLFGCTNLIIKIIQDQSVFSSLVDRKNIGGIFIQKALNELAKEGIITKKQSLESLEYIMSKK